MRQFRAPADEPLRDELRTRLVGIGLERVADAIAADARIAIALPFGEGRSRLGGVPELPVGVDWPQLAGRALVPVASLDCAELPAEADGRDLLPADGALLIFVALHDDDHEWPFLFDDDAPDGVAQVLHVPPGGATRPVEPPAELLAREFDQGLLRERTIAPRAIATLRDRIDAPEAFGLSSDEKAAYDALYRELWERDRGDATPGQLLGHPREVQEDQRRAGEELLLQLHWSEPLGFEYMAVGALFLLAALDDLRARRWERVRAQYTVG